MNFVISIFLIHINAIATFSLPLTEGFEIIDFLYNQNCCLFVILKLIQTALKLTFSICGVGLKMIYFICIDFELPSGYTIDKFTTSSIKKSARYFRFYKIINFEISEICTFIIQLFSITQGGDGGCQREV